MDESKVAAVEETAVGSMAAAGEGENESDDEVDFCTAPDGESVEYDTAKESQGQSQELSMTHTSAAASPEVIHDGNTVKKAERSEERMSSLPGSRVLDLETSAPTSLKKKDMEGREERPGCCSLYQSVSQHKFYLITSLYNIYSLTCSI